MLRQLYLVLYFLGGIACLASHTDTQQATIDRLWASAKANEKNHLWDDAIQTYRMIEAVHDSAMLQLHFGHAYFQMNQLGQALYHYQQALLINPFLNEAQEAKKICLAKMGKTHITDSTWARVSELIPMNAWFMLLSLCLWIILFISAYISLYAANRWLVSCLVWIIPIFIFVTSICVYRHIHRDDGMVLEHTSAFVSPSDKSEIIQQLQAGDIVKNKHKTHPPYLLIELPSRQLAWVYQEKIGFF